MQDCDFPFVFYDKADGLAFNTSSLTDFRTSPDDYNLRFNILPTDIYPAVEPAVWRFCKDPNHFYFRITSYPEAISIGLEAKGAHVLNVKKNICPCQLFIGF